jgi:hypothetical protein
VGLVHTPVQHKGKTTLELGSLDKSTPRYIRNGTLFVTICKPTLLCCPNGGSGNYRQDDYCFQNLNVARQEVLHQLHSIDKRSCSCEAIPQYGHAWTYSTCLLAGSHMHLPALAYACDIGYPRQSVTLEPSGVH